jgi:trimeric autotransporter adhesin
MKQNSKIRFLNAGILLALAVVLFSCGGGGSYSGGGGGGGAAMAPGLFNLSSPADGATGVGTTLMLTWSPSPSASGYRVQVDTVGTFSGTLVINVLLGSTTYSYSVPAGTLTPGTKYFWRVIAENIYGQEVMGPFSFTP